MKYYYSPKTGGLYCAYAHKDIPADAEEIPSALYTELINAPSLGYVVSSDKPWRAVPVAITDEMKAADARRRRDDAITSVMWVAERHRDQTQLQIDTSISEAQFVDLLAFIQVLRDWPALPGWPDIDIPLPPDWLAEVTT
ncbi:hypothetical protein ACVDHJ_01745 [Aeromonas sp. 25-281]